MNRHISEWNTHQVTDMNSLFCRHSECVVFYNNTSVFNENISQWDVSNVTSMMSSKYLK